MNSNQRLPVASGTLAIHCDGRGVLLTAPSTGAVSPLVDGGFFIIDGDASDLVRAVMSCADIDAVTGAFRLPSPTITPSINAVARFQGSVRRFLDERRRRSPEMVR